jgi:hypothetical protein
VSRKSSAAGRAGVRAAALRNGWHGKREQSDCGPEHHEAILRPIELLFLRCQTGDGRMTDVPARLRRDLRFGCVRSDGCWGW